MILQFFADTWGILRHAFSMYVHTDRMPPPPEYSTSRNVSNKRYSCWGYWLHSSFGGSDGRFMDTRFLIYIILNPSPPCLVTLTCIIEIYRTHYGIATTLTRGHFHCRSMVSLVSSLWLFFSMCATHHPPLFIWCVVLFYPALFVQITMFWNTNEWQHCIQICLMIGRILLTSKPYLH